VLSIRSNHPLSLELVPKSGLAHGLIPWHINSFAHTLKNTKLLSALVFLMGQSWDLLCCSDWGYCSFSWSPSQDSLGFWIPDSLWNLDSGFQSLAGLPIHGSGFRIPKALIPIPEVKFSRILDSKSKTFLDSGFYEQKFTGFGIHKQKFTGFRNSQSKISMIMESGSPYIGRIIRFSSRWGSATEMLALVGKTESLY